MIPAEKFPGLVLVSGLGRCGTSLTMQMLAAGGWPVWGADEAPPPGYEHPANMGDAARVEGPGILKWLDPHHWQPPPFYRAIFLTRDLREQARSQIKMAESMAPLLGAAAMMPPADQLASFMRAEQDMAYAALRAAALLTHGQVMTVRFRDLVGTDPGAVLSAISGFVGAPLDMAPAVRQLRPRATGAACLPTMDMELELIQQAEAGGAA